MRAIFFLLFIVLMFLIVRFILQRIRIIRAQQNAEMKAKAHAEKVAEHRMVICEHCRVHLPQNEAVQKGEVFYCSEEHFQADISSQ